MKEIFLQFFVEIDFVRIFEKSFWKVFFGKKERFLKIRTILNLAYKGKVFQQKSRDKKKFQTKKLQGKKNREIYSREGRFETVTFPDPFCGPFFRPF